MPKRKVVLTEFAVQVVMVGKIPEIRWDGFDRFLWELLHGGSVKELAIQSNRLNWRHSTRKA